MESDFLIRGALYLSLTVCGVPGNCAVIAAFLLVAYHEQRLLPADAIVLHLASVNLIVVGIRCLLEALATFQLANVFSDVGCKVVIFVYRTVRSLSIWLTFVLSAYQCLSIAPPGSLWATARDLFAQFLGGTFLVLWVINASMSLAPILYAMGTRNDSALMQNSINVQFCFMHFPSKLMQDANGAIQVVRDVVPMALMASASLIILVFFYRHSRQVKGLRSSSGAGGGGRQGVQAEQRAAMTVVTLVTLYLVFYGVDNGLWVYTLTQGTMSSALVSDLSTLYWITLLISDIILLYRWFVWDNER
uniref:Vomeronasal type-1 receptor n=1 Tax=Denticeps clupeoides TaxID=299321 RepID=A0AAY4E7U3_9TELE